MVSNRSSLHLLRHARGTTRGSNVLTGTGTRRVVGTGDPSRREAGEQLSAALPLPSFQGAGPVPHVAVHAPTLSGLRRACEQPALTGSRQRRWRAAPRPGGRCSCPGPCAAWTPAAHARAERREGVEVAGSQAPRLTATATPTGPPAAPRHLHSNAHTRWRPHLVRCQGQVPLPVVVGGRRQNLLQHAAAVGQLLLGAPHHRVHQHHDLVRHGLEPRLVLLACAAACTRAAGPDACTLPRADTLLGAQGAHALAAVSLRVATLSQNLLSIMKMFSATSRASCIEAGIGRSVGGARARALARADDHPPASPLRPAPCIR